MKSRILIIITIILFSACTSSGRTTAQREVIEDIDAYVEKVMATLQETGEVIPAQKSAPFSKGVNFSGWFEVSNAQRIPFTQYTEQDFENAKSLGADVIRLPVRFNDMTSGEPDYKVDPLLLRLLDYAVEWAEKYELYLIIDNHSFHPVNHTPNDVDKVLIPVWDQVSSRYKNKSNLIIYEILNEPHGISDQLWGDIQGRAIEAIRKNDPDKYIIVGGTDYNSFNKLSKIPEYDDPKLIYTYHFYDPFMFTHQGASWSPPMEFLSGVPFPYDKDRMPSLHSKLRGTWVEGSISGYRVDAAPSKLLGILDSTVKFSNERDVPVFCGEFGVYIPQSDPIDRLIWYKFITEALDRRNISRTSWDYYGGFGIFNSEAGGDFFSDLNVRLVNALGFTPPLQEERIKEPVKTGFVLYDDFAGQGITAGYWGREESVFSYFEPYAFLGDFCIRWENAGRYNSFFFNLARNGDLSYLAANNYCIEFYARSDTPVSFDVRFVMKESDTQFPWRIRYTVNENVLASDGRWHKITIPLNEMSEHGAWVSKTESWHEGEGKFSWDNIERLEFASEHSDLMGSAIFFDSISIKEIQ